jgi:hypothetical protein
VLWEPQVEVIPQLLQSTRPGRAAQRPVAVSQNWLTGQPWLSRQNVVHCPFTQASLGAQSPSPRHPARQASVETLQTLLKAQCSSRLQGPSAVQRVVVVSQKVPVGQSRFEVHDANDWQKPRGLQKLPAGQPLFPVHRQAPEVGSQNWFAPHDALF